MPGAAVSVREGVAVTSGSFKRRSSRWPDDVKGKPVKPVRSTLDIVCLTGSRGRMNDPEVTMSDALANTNLIAHEKALEAAGDAITLVMRVPAPLKSIADQVIRSASSVPANLAEGHGRIGRDRLHFWRIAYASAKEVDTHMRLLAKAGAINHTRTEKALSTFDEVRAMTWRLLKPNI
jgi:four helix bundle protein